MNRKRIGGWSAAVVVGALMTVSLAETAGAQQITPADPPSPSPSPTSYPWWGATHPGQDDPSDPAGNDWHCDRYGNWHNDENDPSGHADGRCQTW